MPETTIEEPPKPIEIGDMQFLPDFVETNPENYRLHPNGIIPLPLFRQLLKDGYEDIKPLSEVGATRNIYLASKMSKDDVVIKIDKISERSHANDNFGKGYDTAHEVKEIFKKMRKPEDNHIVQPIDFYNLEEFDSKGVVLVESHFDGQNLTDYVKFGISNYKDAISVIEQIIHAVSYAHNIEYENSNDVSFSRGERGIFHRDITPNNILVRRKKEGGLETRLADFGIAIPFNDVKIGDDMMPTFGSKVTGDPLIMYEGKKYDVSSEIYSIGATIYYIFTGNFFDPTKDKTWNKEIHEKKLSEALKKLPKQYKKFANILGKCLTTDETKRYNSVENDYYHSDSLKKDLDELLYVKPRKFKKRVVIGGIAAAVLALAISYGTLGSAISEFHKENKIRKEAQNLPTQFLNENDERLETSFLINHISKMYGCDEKTAISFMYFPDETFKACEAIKDKSFYPLFAYFKHHNKKVYDFLSEIFNDERTPEYYAFQSVRDQLVDKAKVKAETLLKNAKKEYYKQLEYKFRFSDKFRSPSSFCEPEDFVFTSELYGLSLENAAGSQESRETEKALKLISNIRNYAKPVSGDAFSNGYRRYVLDQEPDNFKRELTNAVFNGIKRTFEQDDVPSKLDSVFAYVKDNCIDKFGVVSLAIQKYKEECPNTECGKK